LIFTPSKKQKGEELFASSSPFTEKERGLSGLNPFSGVYLQAL
jgi:hypothetical protein